MVSDRQIGKVKVTVCDKVFAAPMQTRGLAGGNNFNRSGGCIQSVFGAMSRFRTTLYDDSPLAFSRMSEKPSPLRSCMSAKVYQLGTGNVSSMLAAPSSAAAVSITAARVKFGSGNLIDLAVATQLAIGMRAFWAERRWDWNPCQGLSESAETPKP